MDRSAPVFLLQDEFEYHKNDNNETGTFIIVCPFCVLFANTVARTLHGNGTYRIAGNRLQSAKKLTAKILIPGSEAFVNGIALY